jgi:hypothetical protein
MRLRGIRPSRGSHGLSNRVRNRRGTPPLLVTGIDKRYQECISYDAGLELEYFA